MPDDLLEPTASHSATHTKKWLTAVLIFSTLLILYVTLYPFDFIGASGQSVWETIARFNALYSEVNYAVDIPRNIILFIPFGAALGGLLYSRTQNKRLVCLLTLVAGTLLSLLVETLQTFSPLRHPTFVDVFANGLGAGIGCVLFVVWGSQLAALGEKLIRKLKPSLTIPRVTFFFLCYMVLLLWLTDRAQQEGDFNNWDTSYPLLLGNEVKGHRPWRGYMKEFFMMDRALAADEIEVWINDTPAAQIDADHLVAFYDFSQAEAEDFPPLQWQGTPSLRDPQSGVFLSFENWLQSPEPAVEVSQALRESSQFTVGLRIAADRFDVGGPQRIFSISQGTGQRNFTLGQENRDLVLRLRMALSNENGRKPELIIPNLFMDDLFHDVIVTYDGASIDVYVDSSTPYYSFELVPSIAFLMMVSPGRIEEVRSTDGSLALFYGLYDALFFVPFAALLIFIYGRLPWPKLCKILLLFFLTVASAFVWEAVLHLSLSNYTVTLQNIWLNLLIGLAALAFFAAWHWGWVRHQAKHT